MVSQKKRILVVDDDPIICDSLREFLRVEGFFCDGSADLRGALGELERQNFNVVITDINMPDGDGFELLRIIRKRYPLKPQT